MRRAGFLAGITVGGLRRESDGNVLLALGPRHDVGPIDFPETYTHADRARFIKLDRTFVRDPAAPNDPSRYEWGDYNGEPSAQP
jgi:hypothetical protein